MNFIIVICKFIQFILKRIGRGSSLPGKIALKMDKNILYKFNLPTKVVAVTGSSGKGSITSMVARTCTEAGYKVAHNDKGSNLSAGIVSLLIENSDLKGNIKTDIIVAEVDERYTKYVFPALKPMYVVITNITRDQPPRQGHFDFVFDEIKKAITDDMELIINADDPMLQKFALDKKCKISYYSISKNKYSYLKSKFENLNFMYCPKCNTKLNYNYYNIEEIGDYYCPNCKFKKPEAIYKCTSIDYNKNLVTIDNNNIMLPSSILYNIYNTLAAYSLLKKIGISDDKIVDSLNAIDNHGKNSIAYQYNGRNIVVLNNKNENSSTFNQSLLYVDRNKKLKTIVVGWKEISRRYNMNDISWLYDIDFEILNKHDIDKIICVGINSYDIATRFKYAGVDEKKIKTFDELNSATKYIKMKTKGDIVAILNFDYVEPFNQMMRSDSND